MLSLKKTPSAPRQRSGSSASTMPNPFDDPSSAGPGEYELDSPTKPGFARATTAASSVDLEAGKRGEDGEAGQPRRKGQGWLSRLFGGLPSEPVGAQGAAQSAGASAGAAAPRAGPARRRNTGGSQRGADDGDSVLASERASQRDAEELELDEVDGLGDYASSSKAREADDEDDFGEFEKATGAVRVEAVPHPGRGSS